MAGQCPAGFGCVDQGSLMGECRRGEPDSEVFNEGDTVDPNDIPDEPPPMPRNDMGSGEDGNEVDEGCDCRQADGASWLALLLIAGLRRRRGGLESPPNTGR